VSAALRLVPSQRRDVPGFVADVAQRVGASLDLQATLQQVTQAVVELLGFQVAVLNLRNNSGELETVNVAGPAQELLGNRDSVANWEALLAVAEPRGSLRFVPHTTPWPDTKQRWVPDLPISDDPDAWHPEDGLFAPLYGSDGRLMGMLSVDCPTDGRRPDDHTCQLLEVFAVQAALALDHARIHARLERKEASARRTFEQAPIGMAVFGPDRRLLKANPAYCEFLGRPLGELVGTRLRQFTHPEQPPVEPEPRIGGDSRRVVKRFVLADGRVAWGRLSLTPLQTEYGETHLLVQLEDVTASHEAHQELERRAATDALTGLDNRGALMEHLGHALAVGDHTAVLFCDVDEFKTVNDTLGHAAGDDLLVEIARNLQAVLRPGDRAGRLGGDEFVVLLRNVDRTIATQVAERIRKAARRVVALDGEQVMTSMTVGVALGDKGSRADQLLAEADRALLKAKRQGRDRVGLA
jgi:diguanylate cyclase (GGDEF)-like protein/PAS domain S-box-containing protein